MKPIIPDVLPLVRAYRANNAAGGSLHIVLEDGNVDDGSVLFCESLAQQNGDADGARVAALLLRMSKTQRRKLTRIA